jgi:serine/threonine protein kinase
MHFYQHEKYILHLDIQPKNILLVKIGKIFIGFWISKT